MFSLTMAAAHMPTADELSAAVAALMKEEKSGELDVKQIHERLLQERNWKVPERRLNKFVKRHRGPPGGASEANASPVRETTRGVFKKLFQRKSPEPAARGGVGAGGNAGGKPAAAAAATVVTDQSPGRISAAASLESSVLPDPRDKDLDGVPSTIVTTTTATAPAPGTSSGAAAGEAAALSDAAADASAANNKSAGGDENEGDDDGESKPCFLLPCEGMSCTVL